jgi:hypothetical protein
VSGKIANEELYDLYSPSNIILLLKSIRKTGVPLGTFEEEESYVQGFGGSEMMERDHFEDLDKVRG